MDQRIKKLWINELRITNKEQDFEYLKIIENDKEYFSTFGILCELYLKEHKKEKWEKSNFYNCYVFEKDINNTNRPFYCLRHRLRSGQQ